MSTIGGPDYGWDSLHCPFFERTVREVFDPYLKRYGFSASRTTRSGGVVYSSENKVFIEISYGVDQYPHYIPYLVMGGTVSPTLIDWRYHRLPVWFLLQDNCKEDDFGLWTFKTQADLLQVFTKMIERIFEHYMKPYMFDLDAVLRQADVFEKMWDEKAQNAAREKELLYVREKLEVAWHKKDYPAVVEVLNSVRSSLTKIEKRKLEYAEKRL